MDARSPDPMRRQTSDGFIEAMCEMLIALGAAAAICIGVISLAAHLNETQKVRGIAENSTRVAGSGEPAPLDHVPRLARVKPRKVNAMQSVCPACDSLVSLGEQRSVMQNDSTVSNTVTEVKP